MRASKKYDPKTCEEPRTSKEPENCVRRSRKTVEDNHSTRAQVLVPGSLEELSPTLGPKIPIKGKRVGTPAKEGIIRKSPQKALNLTNLSSVLLSFFY